MQKPDPQLLDELRAKHPTRKVVALSMHVEDGSPDGEDLYFAVLAPLRSDWLTYKGEAQDPESRPRASDQFARKCVVFPAAADLDSLLTIYPGAADTVANHLAKLAGVSSEARLGKW